MMGIYVFRASTKQLQSAMNRMNRRINSSAISSNGSQDEAAGSRRQPWYS